MRLHLSFFCLIVMQTFVSRGFAQIQWEKFYGGGNYEFAEQLIELSDHNLLLCGYTMSYGAGDADIWMLKTTPSGDTIWTKTYGGPKYECATAVQELPDGNLLVAGNTASFVADTANCAWDIWLLKLNPYGDTIWTKTFYGSRTAGVGMAVDAQGNIYLAANSIQDDPLQNLQVIKCRKDGSAEWIRYFGGADRETLESFCMTKDGALLLLATSQSFSPKTMWLFKLSADGGIIWDKTFGGTFSYGNASDIIAMPEDAYMLAGYNGATTGTTLFLLNMNANGTVNWQKNYSNFTSDWAPCFNLLSSGNFFISAIESPATGRGRQVRIIRVNDTGAVVWSDVLGDTGVYTTANSFLETSDGKFLLLGGTNRETRTSDDLWLVSLTPDMYVAMGGRIEYHLVTTADSSDYTYTILTAPPQMKISGGGTLEWQPQTTAASSELVSIATTLGSKVDTIGFIVHVNKNGTGIVRRGAGLDAVRSGISIRMSGTRALISAPFDRYIIDVYSLGGSKIVSLSKSGAGQLAWNLTDAAGRKVHSGTYVVRVTAGCSSIGQMALTVMR
jgi:hypothetical protein